MTDQATTVERPKPTTNTKATVDDIVAELRKLNASIDRDLAAKAVQWERRKKGRYFAMASVGFLVIAAIGVGVVTQDAAAGSVLLVAAFYAAYKSRAE